MDISNTLQLLCASMMQQQSHNSHSNSNCCCPHHPRGPSARAAGAGHAVARDNKQHRSYAPPNDLQTWRMSVPDQSHIHSNIQSQSSHKPRTRLMDQFPHKLQSTSSTNNTDNLECDNECADGYESVGGSSMLSVEPYHQQHSHRNKKLKKRTSQNLKRNKNNKKNRNRNRKKNRKNKNKNGRNRMYKRNKGKGKKIILKRRESRSRSRNRVLSDLSGDGASGWSDSNEWCDNNNYNYNNRNKDRDLNELTDEDEWYNNTNNKNKNNNNFVLHHNDFNPWQLQRKNKKKKNKNRFIASDESDTDIDIDLESEKDTPPNFITLSASDDDDDDDDDDIQVVQNNFDIDNFDINNVFNEEDLKSKLQRFGNFKAQKEGYTSISELVEKKINDARQRLEAHIFGTIVAGGSNHVFEYFCEDINEEYIKLKTPRVLVNVPTHEIDDEIVPMNDGTKRHYCKSIGKNKGYIWDSHRDGKGWLRYNNTRKRKNIKHTDIHYKTLSNNKCKCLVKRENGVICGKVSNNYTRFREHWTEEHEFMWCHTCDTGHILEDSD